ncbi:DUF7289 family protein [Haloplanus salinarum]|uniref:DUF7289 family protein n=1 Tax=Haloplanus salinarum TaxID=1912324 RepID=UPI00214C00E7|nr:hypothetical protein [Haloplanus salinarum]
MSRPRTPWLYRFVRDRQSQAEPLGVILVIGLVLVSTTVVVTFGFTAIEDVQSRSEIDRAENGMTLLDSRLSTVALGDSERQSVDLPTSNGGYTVDEDAGTIKIVHRNYDGSNDVELVSNTSLGAIVYRNENGDDAIAYQGGGVWRRYDDGSTRMVSPPEFHYREGSLTFPLVRIRGNGSAAGRTTVGASTTETSTSLYPRNETYPDGTEYRNPVENGTVAVTIWSEYAEAWGSYFETRTDGNVSYPAPNQVTVELISIGTLGDFQMPPETQGITVRGMDAGHSLDDFSFTIRPQDTEESSFSNLDWSFYAKQGQREFEIHVGGNGVNSCNEDVALSIYYSDDGGDTHHGWYSDSYLETECGEVNGKPADGDEIWVDVDLTPENSTDMTFQKVKNDNVHFKSGSKTLASDAKFEEHSPDPNVTYSSGNTENLTLVTRHYFAQMGPDFDLVVADGNNAGIGESGSSGYIYYGGSGKVVTYLHITEHNVTATVG